MGLGVERLSLRDWRNFEHKDVSLGAGVTILHGSNARGKTNTVEALQVLTTGGSFRKARPVQLVREGCERGRASMRLTGDGRVVDVSCTVSEGRRRFEVNGKGCHAGDVSQTLMSVLFTPDDLSLVKRGARMRRDEIDSFGRCVSPSFGHVLDTYQRTVDQRNRLLKSEFCDSSLIDAWDASISVGGAALLDARLRLFARLAEKVEEIYADMSEGEDLACAYRCSLGEEATRLGRDEVRRLMEERLRRGRSEDLRRGQTLVGPHRDDLSFFVGGRDARTYGSQGQQRTVALAWKMAEVKVAEEITGARPLLLLDDVMSELDGSRRDAALGLVEGGMQTVVTTVNLGYFPRELLDGAEVISYG